MTNFLSETLILAFQPIARGHLWNRAGNARYGRPSEDSPLELKENERLYHLLNVIDDYNREERVMDITFRCQRQG